MFSFFCGPQHYFSFFNLAREWKSLATPVLESQNTLSKFASNGDKTELFHTFNENLVVVK